MDVLVYIGVNARALGMHPPLACVAEDHFEVLLPVLCIPTDGKHIVR